MTEITADLASEFQAPDRITALVRTADALTADDIDRLAASLRIPPYPGPGIGESAGCGICFKQFDLMYRASQYPTLPNDMGEPEELICDDCQDAMEADRDETGAA